MLSRQYGSKTLRKVFSTLLDLYHEELRQFRRYSWYSPTNKVYLIKHPLSVYNFKLFHPLQYFSDVVLEISTTGNEFKNRIMKFLHNPMLRTTNFPFEDTHMEYATSFLCYQSYKHI